MSSDDGLAPLSPRQPPVEAAMPDVWSRMRSPKMMSYGGMGTPSHVIGCWLAAILTIGTWDGGVGTCGQPLMELQESVVQSLLSSQLVGLWGHDRSSGLQVSSLRAAPSAQLTGVWE